MAQGFRQYKRQLNEWWREPGEKLEEGSGYSGLKAGSDGKNVPSVTKKYKDSTPGEEFGVEGINERKLREEEFEDEDYGEGEEFGDEGFEDEGEDDFNPEAEVPAEIDEPGDVGMPDIQITVDGQAYKLVPVEAGSDDMGEEPLEGEDFEDDGGMDSIEAEGSDVEGGEEEDDDLLKEAVKAALKKKLAERVAANKAKSPLKEKAPAQKDRKQEKFTGEIFDQGNTDDFGHKLDTTFAVEGKAKSGRQYTPSKSDGIYEQRRAKIKAWLEKKRAEKAAAAEIREDLDPLEQEDTADKTLGDDFANIPMAAGADPKMVERLAKIKARREARKKEAVEGVQIPDDKLRADLESTMEESFSFKDLMSGKYGKMTD